MQQNFFFLHHHREVSGKKIFSAFRIQNQNLNVSEERVLTECDFGGNGKNIFTALFLLKKYLNILPWVDSECAPLEELPLCLAELHHGAVHEHSPVPRDLFLMHREFKGTIKCDFWVFLCTVFNTVVAPHIPLCRRFWDRTQDSWLSDTLTTRLNLILCLYPAHLHVGT